LFPEYSHTKKDSRTSNITLPLLSFSLFEPNFQYSSTINNMSSVQELINKAEECFKDDHYDAALEYYSGALSVEPDNVKYLCDRAITYFKLKQYTEAIRDLKAILVKEPNNARVMFKKGQCEFYSDAFSSALNCFSCANSLGYAGCDIWIAKCKAEREAAQEKEKATASLKQQAAKSSATPKSVSIVPSTLAEKVRDQFFQSSDDLTLTILAKNLKQEDIGVELQQDNQVLHITFNLSDGSTYDRSFRLFAPVVASPQMTITPYKIELVLIKQTPDIWDALEVLPFKKPSSSTSTSSPESIVVKRDNIISTSTKITDYPTSSKKLKDWKDVEAEAKKLDEEDKPEGEAAVQKMFQSIYSSADEDSKRAMMKVSTSINCKFFIIRIQ
jgi:suppressor of G2 allele of SKP1